LRYSCTICFVSERRTARKSIRSVKATASLSSMADAIVVKRNQWRCEIQAQKNAERKGNPKSPPDSAVPTRHSKLSIWVCPLHYDLTGRPVSIEDQLLSGALLLWRKVHFTLFFNLPSASQSSTSSSTINTPLSPRQRLHARQPVRRSPQCSIWMSAEPQRSQFSDTTVSHLLEQPLIN